MSVICLQLQTEILERTEFKYLLLAQSDKNAGAPKS
jgi:hypothetical protein